MTYHLLIVDDEPIVRQGLLSFQWEKYGFEAVGVCNNGREALEWLNHNHVELVLTDIKMPGIDGVELSRQIKELYPELIVVLLTGYNEFTYAQQALKFGVFDYLLKPAEDEDFESVLEKAIKVLKERETKKKLLDVMAFHFILRNHLNESHLSDEVLQLNHPSFQSGDAFRLLLVYVEDDRIEPQVRDDMDKWQIVQFSKREWIALLLEKDIQAAIRSFGEMSYMIGISSVKYGRNEIPSAFREANLALQKKFLYPDEHVFQYTDHIDEISQLQDLSMVMKKAILLINRINGLNDRIVEESFKEIFKEIKAKEISVPYIKQLLAYMISALEGEFAKLPLFPVEDWILRKDSFLHTVKTSEQLGAIEQSLFSEICGFIHEVQISNVQGKESAKLIEVLEYIHEHYNQVLLLDLIADHFNMHPNSFSKWFKEYKGMNFIDYLTRYRIDKSREMLEQTELKTSQIAEAVGFQDPRYFGQVFKKLVDLTPTEYRALFK